MSAGRSSTNQDDDVPIINIEEEEEPEQDDSNSIEIEDEQGPITGNKRAKRSSVWNDFTELVLPGPGNVKKAVCNYCKSKLSTGGKGASTSHLKRHSESCTKKATHERMKKSKQLVIPFQPSTCSVVIPPFLSPHGRYSHERMREVMATSILLHEYPFTYVEDEGTIWAFKYSNPEFRNISRTTAKSDCIAIMKMKKKKLKTLLSNVNKISLTTDMWKSPHQTIEYMVITGHFIDSDWLLQKRILSFVKVPPPRRGVDVADAILNCLKEWDIENKVFTISVDNAAYNDVCIKEIKSILSISKELSLNGRLFHVRCSAHILNLLVQDGLSQIKDIVVNVRESVKYINHSDARLKTFSEVVRTYQLKERKLIIDCPTRWNSTYEMLSLALKFKQVFPRFQEKEAHYSYLPSEEDWIKVEKVCSLLEVFNVATHIISGTDYPTANLYLAEIYRVKKILDESAMDVDDFMRRMASKMKEKFDKYWGDNNLLMAIASCLDPRCKLRLIRKCFPLIYSPSEVQAKFEVVDEALQALYNEYKIEMFSDVEVDNSSRTSSCPSSNHSLGSGWSQYMDELQKEHAAPPLLSDLESYLLQPVCTGEGQSITSFDALNWWKENSSKYKILSRMAANILAIPVSTMASESTFSASGRIIDTYRANLDPKTVEPLICGGDWLRNKYGMKKKHKASMVKEIILPF